MQNGTFPKEGNLAISTKLQMHIHFDPAISLLRMYLTDIPTYGQKDVYTSLLTYKIVFNSKYWKLLKCPSVGF